MATSASHSIQLISGKTDEALESRPVSSEEPQATTGWALQALPLQKWAALLRLPLSGVHCTLQAALFLRHRIPSHPFATGHRVA